MGDAVRRPTTGGSLCCALGRLQLSSLSVALTLAWVFVRFLWLCSLSQTGISCRLRGIAVGLAAVYVTGAYSGGSSFTVGSTTLSNLGNDDSLAIKLDASNGTPQWAAR